jgi:hypothetical protein
MTKLILFLLSLFVTFSSIGQIKEDRHYQKIMENIEEVKQFRKYLVYNGFTQGFRKNVTYDLESGDKEIKRFILKFNVREIHVIPKPKHEGNADHFVKADDRIVLVFHTLPVAEKTRSLVFDYSREGLVAAEGEDAEHKIAERIFFF